MESVTIRSVRILSDLPLASHENTAPSKKVNNHGEQSVNILSDLPSTSHENTALSKRLTTTENNL